MLLLLLLPLLSVRLLALFALLALLKINKVKALASLAPRVNTPTRLANKTVSIVLRVALLPPLGCRFVLLAPLVLLKELRALVSARSVLLVSTPVPKAPMFAHLVPLVPTPQERALLFALSVRKERSPTLVVPPVVPTVLKAVTRLLTAGLPNACLAIPDQATVLWVKLLVWTALLVAMLLPLA
jgi:hypothetical protein